MGWEANYWNGRGQHRPRLINRRYLPSSMINVICPVATPFIVIGGKGDEHSYQDHQRNSISLELRH